jgi:hypothetical protein
LRQLGSAELAAAVAIDAGREDWVAGMVDVGAGEMQEMLTPAPIPTPAPEPAPAPAGKTPAPEPAPAAAGKTPAPQPPPAPAGKSTAAPRLKTDDFAPLPTHDCNRDGESTHGVATHGCTGYIKIFKGAGSIWPYLTPALIALYLGN